MVTSPKKIIYYPPGIFPRDKVYQVTFCEIRRCENIGISRCYSYLNYLNFPYPSFSGELNRHPLQTPANCFYFPVTKKPVGGHLQFYLQYSHVTPPPFSVVLKLFQNKQNTHICHRTYLT